MFSKAKTVLILLLLSIPVFSQTKEDEAAKEREKQIIALLAQIADDARGLKLPENRAYLAAKTGVAIWKTDEKRARKLFDTASTELVAAVADAEAQTRNKQYLTGITYGQEPRWNILFMIAECDASLALDLMARTRPPRIERAISDSRSDAIDTVSRSKVERSSGSAPAAQYAGIEINNEQRLITMAAEKDPLRVLKLVSESMKKGVNYQTFSLLYKLRSKDAVAADRLTVEAVNYLIDKKFSVDDTQLADTIGYFLTEMSGDPKQRTEANLRVPDELLRKMAEKLVTIWADPRLTYLSGYNAFPAAEKYFPSQTTAARKRHETINRRNQGASGEEYSKLISGNVPQDEMLARAEKLPRYQRNEVYRKAAEKLSEDGNISAAEELLEGSMSGEESENYINQVLMREAYRLMSSSKYTDAAVTITRIPIKEQRAQLLTQLANRIFDADPKNNADRAAAIFAEARALLPEEPENYDEMTAYFTLATAIAKVDPEQAFQMAERMVPALNEISLANATMTKVRNYGIFRQGEFRIVRGQESMGVYGFETLLGALKQLDLERTVRITNGFTRLDVRLALQLSLIDGDVLNYLPINTGSYFGREG